MLAGLAAPAAFTCPSVASEYFVSPTGADQHDGSQGSPFQTLQRAAREMKPGDICWLRGGRYRTETVLTGLKGKPGKPLSFKSFPGERVVMDGTVALPVQWTAWKNGIYKHKTDKPVWQLFAEGKLVYMARWPNASFDDGSMWRMEECMRWTDRLVVRGKPTGQTTDGVIHDRNPLSREADSADEGSVRLSVRKGINQTTLAETGVDFSGSIAVLNLYHWVTWARPITDHAAGRNWFRYDCQGTEMARYVAYYILGLPALDRPNEWWYDSESTTIYFRPPSDRDPHQLSISGKVRDYSLRLIDCSYVEFQGVDFFSSTFSMTDCDHVVIEDSDLRYPSTNKFMFGEFGWFNSSADSDRAHTRRTTKTLGSVRNRSTDRSDLRQTVENAASTGRLTPSHHALASVAGVLKQSLVGNVMTRIINRGDGPHGNVLRNCEIAYANSPAIALNSPGSVIENCYIHDIEWDVNSSGGSGTLPGGTGSIIRRNTIHTAGNSEGIRPGPGSLVEYNRLWNMGNLQHDGSAINIGTGAQKGTLVRYNWVHNNNRAAIRFDSTTSRMGAGGCAHHNVTFHLDSRGSKFKGDYHLLLNNTFCGGYFAVPNRFGETANHNRNTLVRNNLADVMVAWSMRRPDEPIGARLENNRHGDGVVTRVLRDPANLDFRPRPGADIIDAGRAVTDADRPSEDTHVGPSPFLGSAPDIGAYEAGEQHYWIPGHRHARASTPIPPDGARNVKKDAALMFLEAYEAQRHVVTFQNDTGEHRGRQELDDSNMTDPGSLRPGETYSWRVDAAMPDGSIVGGTRWTFTVEK